MSKKKGTQTNGGTAVAPAPPVKASGNPTPIVKQAEAVLPPEEAIRLRAYQIFMERGCQPGSPEQDWLQAEWELTHGATHP